MNTNFVSEQEKAQYIDSKLRLLRQFQIRLTSDEKTHLRSLNSEIAVDNFCRTIFKNF